MNRFRCRNPCVVGEMFCTQHLIVGKMDNLTISEGLGEILEEEEMPLLPIMANIAIMVRPTPPSARVRERMRIDEPLDALVNQEFIKFEELCIDFRNMTDKYRENEHVAFPEEKFVAKYGPPGDQVSWFQAYHAAKHKLMYDLGSLDLEWQQSADFFRQFCIEPGT